MSSELLPTQAPQISHTLQPVTTPNNTPQTVNALNRSPPPRHYRPSERPLVCHSCSKIPDTETSLMKSPLRALSYQPDPQTPLPVTNVRRDPVPVSSSRQHPLPRHRNPSRTAGWPTSSAPLPRSPAPPRPFECGHAPLARRPGELRRKPRPLPVARLRQPEVPPAV